jgi:hypothetical protein
VLFVLACVFLAAALFPILMQRLPIQECWPAVAWAGILAAASLGGGVFLMTSRPAPGRELAFLQFFTGFSLAVLAIGFGTAAIFHFVRNPPELALNPTSIWLVAVTLITAFMAASFLVLTRLPPEPLAVEQYRLLLLVVGGLVGFVTVVLGFLLPFFTYRANLEGGLDSWRQHPAAVIVPMAALFGGLIAMFASLQLARGMERTNATMRRLIYGYNAVLTALLLLAVLAMPNILAYAEPFSSKFFNHSYDWTESHFHSLDPSTISYLAEVKEPIKVYVLLQAEGWAQNVPAMLDACKGVNRNITWELIDTNRVTNGPRLQELAKKYGVTDEGILVVMDAGKDKEKSEFIKSSELVKDVPDPIGRQRGKFLFTGENAFLNAIAALIEGKVVVYFTQGAGEMSLLPSMDERVQRGSVSKLAERLQRKNFEFKELKFDPGVKTVPKDADVVVVARPTSTLMPSAIEALRDYLKNHDGKLVALLDPVTEKRGDSTVLVQTGLEGLLTEYGVEVGNNHILSLGQDHPLTLLVRFNPRGNNPISVAFRQVVLGFFDARTIKPATDAKGLRVDPLLLAPPQQYIWAEKNFNKDPEALYNELRANEKEAAKVISPEALSVAVTVTEQGAPPGMPPDRAHSSLFQEKRRMVVFGNAGWISDASIERQGGLTKTNLFSSVLSWLRGKGVVSKSRVPDKERQVYELGIPRDTPQESRLYWLPLALLVLTVIGLGTGVWLVRRR